MFFNSFGTFLIQSIFLAAGFVTKTEEAHKVQRETSTGSPDKSLLINNQGSAVDRPCQIIKQSKRAINQSQNSIIPKVEVDEVSNEPSPVTPGVEKKVKTEPSPRKKGTQFNFSQKPDLFSSISASDVTFMRIISFQT